MLGGLLLASISTVLVQSALFQRKSRSGWLEELDEIREGALRDGELDDGVSVSDIWTDLRDGGSYEDPHEISGLYATDDTPDQPGPKEPPRRKEKAKGRSKPKAEDPEVGVDAPAADPAPVAEVPAPVHEMPTPEPLTEVPVTPAPELAPAASAEVEGEQLWVQPAPHPIRPSEMWHPQEMAPPSLGEPSLGPAEERVSSAELDQGRPDAPPFEFQEMTAALEAELVAAADVTVVGEPAPDSAIPIESGEGPLVGAPVGRRNRRDRPTLPTARSGGDPIPPSIDDVVDHPAPEVPPLEPRGETSPLPTEPLPPAAVPAPSAKLPIINAGPSAKLPIINPAPEPEAPTVEAPAPEAPAPEAPTAEVPAPEAPAAEAPAPAPASPSTVPEGPRLFSRAPTPAALEPAAQEPAAPEQVAAPEPEPVVEPEPAAAVLDPTPVAEPAEVQAPPVARALAVGTDGMVDVPGTIVRVRSGQEVAIAATDAVVELAIEQGWAWVSPGDGPATAIRVELPRASVRVAPGATALAVAEADGSAFVIVADGSVDLERIEGGGPLARGTIAMVDPTGGVALDEASDPEIEGDPIVAENLALDAEL